MSRQALTVYAAHAAEQESPDMGVGYDDDTLIAEHQEYEEKERQRRSNRIGVIAFLSVGWVLFLAGLYDGTSGTSVNHGWAVWFTALVIAVTILTICFYWDSAA